MTGYVIDGNSRWVALVRDGSVLMLPRSAGAHDDYWEALAAADAVGAVLARLTRDGIADAPPFALVAGRDQQRRILVRGGFRAVVGGDEITAAGVSTWVERPVAGDAAFELRAPFAATADAEELWRIAEGIVPAAVIRSGSLPAVETAAPPLASATETTVIPEQTVVPEYDVAPEETVVPVDEETIIVSRNVTAEASAGDHDGLTVAVTAMQQLRRARDAAGVRGPGEPAAPEAQPDAAAAPAVTLRLPGGDEETLTGEIVLGRSPSVSRASGARLPRLVTIGAGDPDISRSHVRIGLEGGTVVVTDLHSRNGTSVVQPGRAPIKLRAGEPTPVLAGTVVDLGGGCEITVVSD